MEVKKTLTQRSKFVKRRLQKERKAIKQNNITTNTLKSFGEMQLRLNQLMYNKTIVE